MTLYRLYETYHESSESGTFEYGIFSSKEKAKEIGQKIWDLKKYPKEGREELYLFDSWGGSCNIHISEYELDKEINEDYNGYT